MTMDDWRLLVATNPAESEALVSEVVEAWQGAASPDARDYDTPLSSRLIDALNALAAAVVRPPGLWTR